LNQPKPWIAVLSSFLAPGLGQLYIGYLVRAVTIFVLVELFMVVLALLFVVGPVTPAVLFATPLLALAFFVAIALDARGLAERERVRFFRRVPLVSAMVIFVLGSVIIGESLRELRNRVIGEAYRMPSGAMFPTMLIGGHFYSNRLAYLSREPKRGDVVVVVVGREGSAQYPADLRPELPREYFVKRVVGIPGDLVAFKGAHLSVNDVERTAASDAGEFIDPEGRRLRALAETLDGREYQVLDSEEIGLPDFGPMLVEPGRFFIAGDNRDHSKDSRFFGTVGRESVLAPTSSIYWSWDFNGSYLELINPFQLFRLIRERTRWSRIGMPTNRGSGVAVRRGPAGSHFLDRLSRRGRRLDTLRR